MKKDKGKIIAVTSTTGGVGKTITTLNLAGSYHLLGYKVLIIDFDLFGGDIALSLNLKCDKTVFNLVLDLSNNRYEKVEDYIYKYNDNIDIISAPKDPRQANKIDSKYIPLILDSVLYKYDAILIDTTHVLNETNIILFDNSDSILVLFSNDLYSLKNTRTFISILKDANYTNYFTVLNESILDKNYYNSYDMRTIIKSNIDFTIPKTLHISKIDKIISSGQIPILLNNRKDNKHYELIAKKLIEEVSK